jgi:cell division protease FtsH
MTPEAITTAVRRTGELVPGLGGGTHYSGDHIQSLCRQIARSRLLENNRAPTSPADVERAIEEYLDRPKLTSHEETVVATHEAGHAVCALRCKHAPPIERISIRGDLAGALGFVEHAAHAHKYVVTQGQLTDAICTLFGGREAEVLLCDDVSIGAASDLRQATRIARALVDHYGLGGDGVPQAHWDDDETARSEERRAASDRVVAEILERERQRARAILTADRALVVALRDLLVEKKVLERATFLELANG